MTGIQVLSKRSSIYNWIKRASWVRQAVLIPMAPFCSEVKSERRDRDRSASGRVTNWLRGNTSRLTRDARAQIQAIFSQMNVQPASREQNEPSASLEVSGTPLRVLKYPHPQLRQDNEAIVDFSDDLRKTAAQMLSLMYAHSGIGLAAPQVGINKRLMVFNESGDPEDIESEMVLCNPVILSKSDETNVREEGCLSFPKLHGFVKRHVNIEIEYQDLWGATQKVSLSGMPARIFQHEFDHLDKTLFIDHFRHRDRIKSKQKLDTFIRVFGEGGAI